MTTGISLVRENTAAMQPPRALWVTFPLGRPLGRPGDAAFQHRVIAAALELLGRPSGPVLEDYPEDTPAITAEDSPACPVSFARPATEADTWKTALLAEVQSLMPWHDLARRRRGGRTLVGLTEGTIQETVARLGQLLDDDELPVASLRWFKAAIEDAKVFYIEALTAQPGDYSQDRLDATFWDETRMGAAIRAFSDRFQENPDLALLARIIAPRNVSVHDV